MADPPLAAGPSRGALHAGSRGPVRCADRPAPGRLAAFLDFACIVMHFRVRGLARGLPWLSAGPEKILQGSYH